MALAEILMKFSKVILQYRDPARRCQWPRGLMSGSEALACSIVGWNPAGIMDVCLMLCLVG